MTRLSILALLARNDRAVEAAMVALYRRQTADEQHTSSTVHSNGRGFNAFDAERGTYYAEWVLKGKPLTGRHLEAARRMATYYVRQLVEVARDKQRAQQKAEADRLEAIETFGSHMVGAGRASARDGV